MIITRKRVSMALLSSSLAVFITACSHPEKGDFIAGCVEQGISDSSGCDCFFDLGEENLSEDQMELFIATATGDQQRVARIRTKLGIISGATAAGKLAWVTANAADACGID